MRPEPTAGRGAGRPFEDELAARRRFIGILVTVAVLAAVFVFLTGARAKADLERPQVAGRVTVQPGQTLWDVAVRNAPPGADPRDYLQRLRELNRIGTGPLPEWTVLLLPVAP